jgi:hypothetical protein
MTDSLTLTAQQVSQFQHPAIGNEYVIGNQRIRAGSAHSGDVPGILDPELGHRSEGVDELDITRVVFDPG